MYNLSVVNGIPDSSLVYIDDVSLQSQGKNWEPTRLLSDGIILSYTNTTSDASGFYNISNGKWSPHYVIAVGGSSHPSKAGTTYPGQIFQLVSERYCAKHCPAGVYPYSGFVSPGGGAIKPIAPDRMTIGVSLVGVVGQSLHAKQLESLQLLIEDIMTRVPSITRICGRRHVTYDSTLGYHLASDPESSMAGSGRIDFSSQDMFGEKADQLLNYDVCWTHSGSMMIKANNLIRTI